MTSEEIKTALDLHVKWLRSENIGKQANLSDADLSEMKHTVHIPLVQGLNKKILDALNGEIEERLDMSNWHTCETTHCYGGWAVFLAGESGKILESILDTNVAAALIITKSCPYLNGKVPNFYASNEDALAEIKRCAEIESAGCEEEK